MYLIVGRNAKFGYLIAKYSEILSKYKMKHKVCHNLHQIRAVSMDDRT